MVSKNRILEIIRARLNKPLTVAEAALPPQQFPAFRKFFLDEFGKSGIGQDLDRLFDEEHDSVRHGTGGKNHAKKEVNP